MHKFRAALPFAILLGLSAFSVPGLSQESRQVLHNHVRPAVSSGQAALVGALPATQQMRVSIVLPLRNQAELNALLGRLYDPSSPDYRHFLSVEQFTEQFGPTAGDYQMVVDFARSNGLSVTDTPANRLLVPITGTVAQIEKAFHVSMKVYQHPTENITFFSPDREPSLDLGVQVAHIAGLNNFSIPRPMLTKAAVGQVAADAIGSGPDGQYLASDIRAAYYGGTALTGSGQAVGLFELDGYYLADVNLVYSNSGQSYSVPINNVLLEGATGDPISGDDAEEVIDIVQAIGMAPGLSQVRVYIANYSYFNDADVLNAMAAENICKQLSISWSWEPDDPSVDDPIFQEIAAQGQSLFTASGDYGAYDPPYWVSWYPAEEVYVTDVGGTSLITNGPGGSWMSETAWNNSLNASGGGPSPDGNAIPAWQIGVANSSNGASQTLRDVPDMALEADTDNFNCTVGVCLDGWGGTSFSAPRWAGFMALVNQQAVAAGTAPLGGLGFINPAIYSIGNSSNYGSAFHDITSGNDDCCNQPVWYNAVTGYDLLTGWGSPNGQNLIDALAGPPANGFTLTNSALTTGLSINQGAAGAVTITVNDQGGFSGSVNLAVSALPGGVTGTFGTNPTTGTSVLTLTASSSATPGSAYVTVTGTSGSVTATTSFSLTVVAPGFALSVPPASVTMTNPTVPVTVTVTVNELDGFTGSVTLAASGLPSGMTATFSPNPTTGSSVLSLTADSSITIGGFYLTITGTAGTLSASTHLYAIVENPFFTLSDAPGSLTLNQGGSSSSGITVTPYNGFTGNVTLTASGLPSGVTASFNPNPLTASSVVTLTASSSATPGSYSLTITGTSGTLTASTSLALTVINPSPSNTTTTLSSSANPSTYGLSVTFTAAVSPTSATGTVQFLDGSTALGTVTISGGWAAISVATLSIGAHSITAVYSGDGNNTASTSAVLSQTVNKIASSVAVAASPNPSTFGQSVTLSAAVTPNTATGSVQFLDGATVLGTATIAGGAATLSITTLSVGTHSITAVYSGDGNDASSTSAALSQTVNKIVSSVALASSVNPSTFGQPVTFTAAVSPASATGSVQFLDGPTALGTATVGGGVAGLALTTLAVGSHSITAVYSGDTNDSASTSAVLSQTVNKVVSSVALASSANPSTVGHSVTFTATVTPSAATGTVHFLDGATALGTVTIGGGTAALSLTTLAVGSHSITAAYSGDANDAAATSAVLTETVNKTASSVVITSSRNPSTFGQSVTLSAKVTPSSATGYIQFRDGAAALGTVTISGGAAALSLSSLAAGSHSITAVYSGDANDAASTSAALTETVNKATTTVALTSSKNPQVSGSSVTFTAAVSPSAATGSVEFLDGTTVLGTVTLSGGEAAFALSTLAVGSHSITAVYSGDANHVTSTLAVLTENITGAACHVTYGVTSQWNGGFGTAITIKNTGTTAVNGWNLTWTWAGNQKITESWDSSYSQSGANAKLTNASYNAAIAAGATITGIGFNASFSGTNTAPSAFSLNGTLCK